MRILIADDNEANRFLAVSILEREGHIAVTAPNGEKALQECTGVKFDLILMDILMPVMDGLKTLGHLRRSNGRNAKTPVFALTAYSSAADIRMYKQAGFDCVLPKPLRQNDVERAWKLYTNPPPSIHSEKSPPTPIVAYTETMIIDFEHWNEIKDHTKENELQMIVKDFWQSALDCIRIINKNTKFASQSIPQNLNLLRKAAHTLKGLAASLALRRLEHLAAELQNAPPEEITSLFHALRKCAVESRQAHILCLRSK